LQLVPKQDVRSLPTKALGSALEALDLYGVEKPCVDQEALEACGLAVSDLVMPVELLDRASMQKLLKDSDVVINL
ncbi:MAG: DsrE family protein, partial [Gammaproteobacteria bacterium]